MCVRYTLHKLDAALGAISKSLSLNLAPPDWAKPKYNVTLTSVVPVVSPGDEGPEVRSMIWGLVPFYERDKTQMRMLPNATAEKARTSAAFRQATARQRCLVPANGFYEWRTVRKLKLPHLFTLKQEEPFAFAGIWEQGADSTPANFAILTTTPNALVGTIHNRMPVLLTQDTMPEWIGSEPLPAGVFQRLTQPLAADRMEVREVNRYVSNSRNEGPPCHAPPDTIPPALDLFPNSA